MALTDSLVAHYLLHNNANDSHGIHDGIDTDVTYSGDSAYFDGNSGIITATIPDAANVNITTSLWVQIDSWYESGILAQTGNGDEHRSRGFTAYFDAFSYYSEDSDGTPHDIYIDIYTGMKHYVGVQDGSTIKAYVDGVLINTVNIGTPANYEEQFTFGAYSNGVFNFTGNISNIRIYSEAKDQAFINELYAEGYDIESPFISESFLDISEDITMVSEPFLDVSQDELPSFQVFQDISVDVPMTIELFQDISIDHQGYIEIFSDISTNEGIIFWSRFYDVSADIPDTLTSIVIKRINE